MIEIHTKSGDVARIVPDDGSYRYRALMGKPRLVLKFSLPEYRDFPVGSWCMFQNERFTLKSDTDLKKHGTRNIEYNMTLGQDEDDLGLYKMRNSVDGRLKYSMCAKPHELVEEIVKNLNARSGDGVWSTGTCIEANEKTIEFNHAYIDDALQSVADLFETEWEIVNHVISLHKVEYFKDDPLPLSYGKGNGFVPGVGRTTQSDEMPVKRLYTQGGERNIDRSKYGSPELLLPKGQTLEYEGRTYKSDAQGCYIERIDRISDAVREDSLDCSDIYPSRVGTVSGVEVIDADRNFYDFTDNSIPGDLNFNDYIIAGETATVIFQSGMLAGDDKEFEFKYKHAERRFEIVPQEIDGITMPNETFKPEAGDTYAVFGIMLPDTYICNNLTKEGASWDMFREAARKLYESEDQKFTFSGELQGLWAKRNWLNVGGYMRVGAYILFSDEQFAKEGVPIRITGIKDYVNSPYSPSVELSNSVPGQSLSSKLNEIDNQEVVIDNTKKGILQFTKRRFRDALETIEMLNDSLLDFSVAVNPVTVQTMAALIGDESLQFRFVNSKSNLTPVVYNITYDNQKKQLHCPHGFLQHMTLGITSISGSHKPAEYKVWEMSEYLSPVLTEADSKYYLYAKVSRNDTNAKGTFVLSETAIAMDDADGYYHLLVGVLNSETNGERSYVDLYGFTEILPGRITADRIVSSDGKTFFDLANSVIGGKIDFQDGLVSGLIGIGNENGINAGMSGAGNGGGSVRFWAGAGDDMIDSAPFRVTDDGRLYSENADIKGVLWGGSVALKFTDLPDSEEIRVSFDNGFNFSGKSYQKVVVGDAGERPYYIQRIYLPVDTAYNGVQCVVQNTAGASESFTDGNGDTWVSRSLMIMPDDGAPLLINSMSYGEKDVRYVQLYGKSRAVFSAVLIDGKIRWAVDNSPALKYSMREGVLSSYRGLSPLYVSYAGHMKYFDNGKFVMSEYSIIAEDYNFIADWISTGRVKLTFWEKRSSSFYFPLIMTSDGKGYGCVTEKTDAYFIVETSDGASNKNLNFDLIILEMT